EDAVAIGITICEDIWNDNEFWKDERLYPVDPIAKVVESGAQLLINISASPFVQGKPERRLEMLRHIARRRNVPIILVNQVGGNDRVVVDGGSGVVMPDGQVPALAGWFEPAQVIWDTAEQADAAGMGKLLKAIETPVDSIIGALRLGLRDYMAR